MAGYDREAHRIAINNMSLAVIELMKLGVKPKGARALLRDIQARIKHLGIDEAERDARKKLKAGNDDTP